MIIHIHESQYPQQVVSDLLESLRSRVVNHKFHYDSIRQTQRWLELHEAYSPARTDADCLATYDQAFREAIGRIKGERVLLVSLGCGGAQKDRRLAEELRSRNRVVQYLAIDVTPAMVITACQEVAQALPSGIMPPIVCDLARLRDLEPLLVRMNEGAVEGSETGARLITFFGLIPNFEPGKILPLLATGVRPGDWVLFSANLAPGPDYQDGVRQIMPLYDNQLTRDWLTEFLYSVGVGREDGRIDFSVQGDPEGVGLRKVVATFKFDVARSITVHGEPFSFNPGDTVQLFFSYRYTSGLLEQLLTGYGFAVHGQWITRSGEEGVFLLQKGT